MHHRCCVVLGSHIYILIKSSPPRHDCAGNVGNEIDGRNDRWRVWIPGSLCHDLNDEGDDGHNATNGYY